MSSFLTKYWPVATAIGATAITAATVFWNDFDGKETLSLRLSNSEESFSYDALAQGMPQSFYNYLSLLTTQTIIDSAQIKHAEHKLHPAQNHWGQTTLKYFKEEFSYTNLPTRILIDEHTFSLLEKTNLKSKAFNEHLEITLRTAILNARRAQETGEYPAWLNSAMEALNPEIRNARFIAKTLLDKISSEPVTPSSTRTYN